ncbi:MAG: hypothetical protein II881_05830 [Oscillospiraceae bacterium]|nr:hypothetical protein [Oscillospiraceae bacterium]
MMNRKAIAIIMALILCVGALCACGEGWVEPVEEDTGDIILSGSKWNGKVAITITLHPDGTLTSDANGTVTEGTWEKGTGDVAIVFHAYVKENLLDFEVYDDGNQYTCVYHPVPDFSITGAKPGAEAASETPSEAPAEAPAEQPAAPAEEVKPAPKTGDLVLEFTADINSQLATTFWITPETVSESLEGYTPEDSEDVLFSWLNAGNKNFMDFYKNGTYEYRFTMMEITERGTWKYEGGVITITTESGREMSTTVSE